MKRKTMRTRLLSVILPVTLAALLLTGLATTSRVRQVVYGQNANRTLMMLEQIGRMIGDRLNMYYTRMLRLNMDLQLQQLLRQLKYNQYDARFAIELDMILSRYFDYDNSVVGIVFFMEDGSTHNYKAVLDQETGSIRKQPWYRDFLANNKRFYALGRNDLFSLRPYSSYMFAMLYKPLKPYLKNGVETVCVAFQDDAFKNIYREYELERGGDIIIVDQYGQVVGTANQGSKFDKMVAKLWSQNDFNTPIGYFSQDEYFISYYLCEPMSWTIVHMLETKSISGDIRATIVWIVLFVAVVCVVLEVVIFIQVKRATHPLEALTVQAQTSLRDGNPITSEDMRVAECIALSSSLNEMMSRIGDMLRHVERVEKEKVFLELSALQSQISPHFMLNTITAIRALAMESDVGEQVDNALRSFSQLLDNCLTHPSSQHTLADEQAYLNSYLDIMRIRYHKRIDANIEIPTALMGVYILKFLIQPIVENSFIHGFSETEKGMIDIRVSAQGDILYVSVADNGKGMSIEMIERVMSSDRNEEHGRFSRIGLGNIRRRIAINYPDGRFGMSISSNASGTQIDLSLPLFYRNKDDVILVKTDREVW